MNFTRKYCYHRLIFGTEEKQYINTRETKQQVNTTRKYQDQRLISGTKEKGYINTGETKQQVITTRKYRDHRLIFRTKEKRYTYTGKTKQQVNTTKGGTFVDLLCFLFCLVFAIVTLSALILSGSMPYVCQDICRRFVRI